MDGNIHAVPNKKTNTAPGGIPPVFDGEREDYRKMCIRNDKRINVIAKEIAIIKEGFNNLIETIETMKEVLKHQNNMNKKMRL